jgi:2-hydroxychromene-2-carboxylate isomerase
VFFYDLGCVECYLAAEQVMHALPAVPEWEPVLAAELGIDTAGDLDRTDVEARAGALGLQPLRWPPHMPPDTTRAMLAAAYTKRAGRAVAFSLAAFRQAFAAGRDLGDAHTVLIAGAACEIHPTAFLKGMELRSTRAQLEAGHARARGLALAELPAIAIGDRVVSGRDAVPAAAVLLGARA